MAYRWLGPLLGAALAMAAAPAEAQNSQDQERARLHFQSGASYYEAGNYEDALREFQRSYELSGRPELFYNFSLCHQNLGQLEEAINYLERYLGEVENIPNRANLELRVENLRRRQAEERATVEQPIEPPVEEPVAEEPGVEEPAVEPVEPSTGEPVVVPEAPSASGGPNVPAIIGFGAASVGVVMVAVFGPLTIVENDRVRGLGCADPELLACGGQVGTLNTYALLTDIGFGVALAGAVVGSIFLFFVDSGTDESVAALPWVDPVQQAGGVTLTGSF